MQHPPLSVLCIGECMAELAPLDGPRDYRLGFAGDTFNTAWYLRQLRADAAVGYFSAVGTDPISAQMLAFMQNAGIDTAHIAQQPGRSVGMYLISLQNGERSFSYWRDTSAARLLASDTGAMAAAMASADLLYFSGITLAILDAPARARLLAALGTARANGKTVVFDPNLRPRLWGSLAQMTDAIMQGAGVSDMILPSFEDEAGYFGDATPDATADRYLAAGAACVIVKNGPAPVVFVEGGQRGAVEVMPAKQVVDTTSAGDSFNAGFLATMGTDMPMADRITLASTVAGQVIGGKGALIALNHAALPSFQ